jgi:uncharacterized membrane protein YraQ (UPF0718 family)
MELILFFALMLAVIVGLVMQHFFLQEMRSHHPDVWESLGRPTLIRNNTISNGLAVLRFLWRKEYQALDDAKFIRFAAFVRAYLIAYTVFFALIVIGQFYWSR